MDHSADAHMKFCSMLSLCVGLQQPALPDTCAERTGRAALTSPHDFDVLKFSVCSILCISCCLLHHIGTHQRVNTTTTHVCVGNPINTSIQHYVVVRPKASDASQGRYQWLFIVSDTARFVTFSSTCCLTFAQSLFSQVLTQFLGKTDGKDKLLATIQVCMI